MYGVEHVRNSSALSNTLLTAMGYRYGMASDYRHVDRTSPDPPAGLGMRPVRLPKAPLQLQAAALGPLKILQLPRDVALLGTL